MRALDVPRLGRFEICLSFCCHHRLLYAIPTWPSRLREVGSTSLSRFLRSKVEAQPGVEPGYETVPRLRVTIPPPGLSFS